MFQSIYAQLCKMKQAIFSEWRDVHIFSQNFCSESIMHAFIFYIKFKVLGCVCAINLNQKTMFVVTQRAMTYLDTIFIV